MKVNNRLWDIFPSNTPSKDFHFKYLLFPGLIVSFILLTIGMLTAWNFPAQGYEISIYESTPLLFWIALIIGYVVSIFTILIHHKVHLPNIIVIAGYVLLILATLSLVALFIIRGYLILNMWGDTGTHLGNINSLIVSGFSTSMYPADYFLITVAAYFTGISCIELMNLHSILFVGLFILGVYLLSKHFFKKCAEWDLCVIIACFFTLGSTN